MADFVALGIYVDLPVLALLLALSYTLRTRIARLLRPLPRPLGALLCLLPLIILEENINCGAFGCLPTLWPPTMNFLLGFALLVLLVAQLQRRHGAVGITAAASVLGLAFELFLGGSALPFRALPLDWLAAVAALTLVSYALIFFLPLHVLLARK
ncbi:MAG: hypothetical protein AAGH73_02400 [Pseudomonadota bacterium]